MSVNIPSDFWPRPIAYLAGPYLCAADEYVTVAEITDDAVNGCQGMRQLYSCLIPVSEVDEAINTNGGIGWKVDSWGPHPIVPPEGGWTGSFWIDGPKGTKKRYEVLVHGWLSHNQTVMVPDNSLLMCYGLVPRILNDGRIIWDDPQKPVYDVVEVKPLSLYKVPRTYSPAGVRILRQYIEDYASLKGCAVVTVFYEERLSFGDPDVEIALGASKGMEIKLPGRLLTLKRVEPKHFHGADQLIQIWGCRLILKPTGRPVSEESDPELLWPDSTHSFTSEQVRNIPGLLNLVYVADNVLKDWEGREEFSVHPMSGHVSYDGWWSTSYSHRHGRHHIALELRKLYEGTPPYVIKHFHRFAVTKAEADHDLKRYGNRHIGQRAEEVIYAFLALTESLASLSAQLAVPLDQEDFCGLTTERVRYHGWWTMDGLKKLGHVVPLRLTEDMFLERCMRLFQLLERLKPGPIKQLLHGLGFKQNDFRELGDIGALRLLGTLCQFADLAQKSGLGLISDFSSLRTSWDKNHRLSALCPLFALVTLRHLHGHVQGEDGRKKLGEALQVFALDATAMKAGWGLALDTVYDKIAVSLRSTRDLISIQGDKSTSGLSP